MPLPVCTRSVTYTIPGLRWASVMGVPMTIVQADLGPIKDAPEFEDGRLRLTTAPNFL